MKRERFSHLISRVYATDDVELACKQVGALLPGFVEAELAGGLTGTAAAAIRTHIAQCPDCEALCEGLRLVLEAEAEGELPSVDEEPVPLDSH